MVGNKEFSEEYEKAKTVLETFPFSRFKICSESEDSFSFSFLAIGETYYCEVKIPDDYPASPIIWSFSVNGQSEERYNRLYRDTDCREMPFTAQFQQIVIDMYTFCHHDIPKEYITIDPEFAEHYLKLISPIKGKIDDLMHKHLKPEKMAEEELVEWSDMFLSFLSRNYPLNRKKNANEVTYIVDNIGRSLVENYGACIKEDQVNREQEERIKKYLPKPSSSKKKKSKSKSKSPAVAGVETVRDKVMKENISDSNQN
ncbi:hypothetical protein ACTXT7_007480 [Hymenolepis weldensis]